MEGKTKRGAVAAYVVMTAFLFGTMEVSLKVAGSGFDALQLTFLRFAIGGLVLLPFAVADLRKRQVRLSAGDWGYLLTLGVICIPFSMALFQIGIMRIHANLAAIIISANPVFTMLFAHVLTEDKFTSKKAVVLLLSVAGLVIVADPRTLLSGSGDAAGLLAAMAGSVSFGLYTAYGKRRVSRIGGMAQNSFSFLLGSAVLLAFLLASGRPVVQGVTPATLPLLLYLGLFVTGLGYFCFLRAIAVSGPSTASLAFFLKPIIAVALAAVLLQEPVTVNVIMGVALLLLGSAFNLSGIRISRRQGDHARRE
ncbi:MAG: DMT family transporter [Intestinibacillus sp.]